MFKDVFNSLLKSNETNANNLAKQMKLPKSVVYGWKNGDREPTMEQLKKLSAHFGVSLEFLCETEELQLPSGEQKLITLLRSAKTISNEAYDNIIDRFSKNVEFFIDAYKEK
ncbi:MAG: helix-turn-helix transcriptional regulator [Clostridia bacterium]|nr:helix-turn-helix transcriptional regulator [Clostridia bacterium]